MADVQIGPSIRAQLGKASPVIGRFEAMILLGHWQTSRISDSP